MRRRFMAVLLVAAVLLGAMPGTAAAYTPEHEIIRVGVNAGEDCYKLTPSVELESDTGLYIGAYHTSRLFTATDAAAYERLVVTAAPPAVVVTDGATGEVVYMGASVAVHQAGADSMTYTLPANRYADNRSRQFTFSGGFHFSLEEDELKTVNYVALEDYVKGVLPAVMDASWPGAALEAQAICCRTWAVYLMERGEYGDRGYDVTNGESTQLYVGAGPATDATDRAVEATAGQYILYGDGPILAAYHVANGGATEDSMNVWGVDYPYLTGVTDPYETISGGMREYINWTDTLTVDSMITMMSYADEDFGLTDIDSISYEKTALGNIYSITFRDASGNTRRYEREACRTVVLSAMSRYVYVSQRFEITANLAPDGEVTYTVTNYGCGHNLGLSQYGAKAMADRGWSARDIIYYYYTDVVVHTPGGTEDPVGSLPFADVPESQWYYGSVDYVYTHGLMNGTSETAFDPDLPVTRGMFVTILGRMAGVDPEDYALTGVVQSATEAYVNMRAGPGTDYEVAALLPVGTTVTIVGQTEADGRIWYRVAHDDAEGYVRGDLLTALSGAYSDVEPGMYYTGYVQWGSSTGVVQGYADGTFLPDDTLSRQEMCTLLYRYCSLSRISLERNITQAAFGDLDSVQDYAREAVVAMQQAAVIQGDEEGNFVPEGTSLRSHVAEMLAKFHQAYCV